MPYDLGRPGALHRMWEFGAKWALPLAAGIYVGVEATHAADSFLKYLGVAHSVRALGDFATGMLSGYYSTVIGNKLMNELEMTHYRNESNVRRVSKQHVTQDIQYRNSVNTAARPEPVVDTLPDYLRGQIIEQ